METGVDNSLKDGQHQQLEGELQGNGCREDFVEAYESVCINCEALNKKSQLDLEGILLKLKTITGTSAEKRDQCNKSCLEKIVEQIQCIEKKVKDLNEKNKRLEEKVQNLEKKNKDLQHPEVRLFHTSTGQTFGANETIIEDLKKRIQDLEVVSAADESHIEMVFCPIVSRSGTDVDRAVKRFSSSTDSKLRVLVVLHHTFDSEKTLPDSRSLVRTEGTLSVDCLFYEDGGLLKCQKNSEATDTLVNWLIQEGSRTGLRISPYPRHMERTKEFKNYTPEETSSVNPHRAVKQTLSWRNKEKQQLQPPTTFYPQQTKSSSSDPVRVYTHASGDTHQSHLDFVFCLKKQTNMSEVSSTLNSDVILLFWKVSSPSDIESALQACENTPEKPIALVLLHFSAEPVDQVPHGASHRIRRDVLVVDCVVFVRDGLPLCQVNLDAISTVSRWISQR